MFPALDLAIVGMALLPSRRGAKFLLMVFGILAGILINLQSLIAFLPMSIRVRAEEFVLPNDPNVTIVGNILVGLAVVVGLTSLFGRRDRRTKLARSLQRRGDYLGAAEMLLQADSPRQALPLLKKARAWAQAAEVAEQLGKEDDAADLFRKAGGKHLKEASRIYRKRSSLEAAQKCDHDLAKWYTENGRFDSAIEAWVKAGELNRAVHIASTAIQKQRINPLQSAFKVALKAAEETRNLECVARLREMESNWLAAARAWRSANEHEKAALNFRKAGKIDEAARAEAAAGNHHAAALLRIEHVEQLQDRLRVCRAQGTIGAAEAAQLDTAIDDEVRSLVPELEKQEMEAEVISVLTIAERTEEAVARLEASGRDSEAADLARDSQHFLAAARILEKLSRFSEASDTFELAGDLEKAASCAEAAGEDERALQLYRGLGKVKELAHCLGRIGLLQEGLKELHSIGEIGESCALLRAFPGPIPDIPEIVLDMTNWLVENEGIERAISCLQRAVRGVALQPSRLEPAVALARLLHEAGEPEKAKNQLDRVLGFDFSHEGALALRKELLEHQPETGADSSEGDAMTGDHRYEILDELGRGGMGVVYRARDTRLEREVAIKVLRTTSPTEAQRLEQEAKVAATLNHPGIVTVYDFEPGFDGYFIAMEYVPGQSLDQVLKQSPETMREHLPRLLYLLADAVAYAHSRKVVHRDLKPGNVLLTLDFEVKVLDFGIATRFDTKTSKPSVVGTPFYMAPEQIRGEAPNPATDIYSFGATAFHLATGRPPFKKGNVIDAHLNAAPPDPRKFAPDLPSGLPEIMLRCLEKDAADRFANADDLRQALRNTAP